MLWNSMANPDRFKKTIGIKKSTIEHGVGQFGNRCDFTIDQITLTLCWLPLKLRHANYGATGCCLSIGT